MTDFEPNAGPNTRALLTSARSAPSEDDEMNASRERIRGTLGRKLGVAAVGLGVATTASTAGAGASASLGMGLLGKVIIGVAAIAISAGGVAITRQPAPTHAAAPPSIIAPRAIELPIVAVAMEPRASESALPVVASALAPVVTTPSPTLGAPTAPATAKAALSIDHEVAALRRANDAIAAGNAGQALSILDATPATTLTEEHTGLRLLSRCMLGHEGAPSAAKSFLSAHPSSPLGARLRIACAGF